MTLCLFGIPWAAVGNVGAILGLSLGVLGATWIHLGCILGHVGAMLGKSAVLSNIYYPQSRLVKSNISQVITLSIHHHASASNEGDEGSQESSSTTSDEGVEGGQESSSASTSDEGHEGHEGLTVVFLYNSGNHSEVVKDFRMIPGRATKKHACFLELFNQHDFGNLFRVAT